MKLTPLSKKHKAIRRFMDQRISKFKAFLYEGKREVEPVIPGSPGIFLIGHGIIVGGIASLLFMCIVVAAIGIFIFEQNFGEVEVENPAGALEPEVVAEFEPVAAPEFLPQDCPIRVPEDVIVECGTVRRFGEDVDTCCAPLCSVVSRKRTFMPGKIPSTGTGHSPQAHRRSELRNRRTTGSVSF